MKKTERQKSIDQLAELAEALIEQVKVLVSAVDDLRCEVEWCSRNAASERLERQASGDRDKAVGHPPTGFEKGTARDPQQTCHKAGGPSFDSLKSQRDLWEEHRRTAR